MTQIPAPRANGVSANDYCAKLPRQRFTHEAQGLILLFPATGLTAVPFEMHKGGSWTVVVSRGSDIYPRGGYHLSVSRIEIETAIELTIGEAAETRFVYTPEEAAALPDRESILTPGGIAFRKWDDYENDGEPVWTRFLHEPLLTRELDATLHFPAKVLGTARAEEKENADV